MQENLLLKIHIFAEIILFQLIIQFAKFCQYLFQPSLQKEWSRWRFSSSLKDLPKWSFKIFVISICEEKKGPCSPAYPRLYRKFLVTAIKKVPTVTQALASKTHCSDSKAGSETSTGMLTSLSLSSSPTCLLLSGLSSARKRSLVSARASLASQCFSRQVRRAAVQASCCFFRAERDGQ